MKRFSILSLLVCFVLSALPDRGKAQTDSPRFTEEAQELLGQVSQSYDYGNRRMPAGPMDYQKLSQLSQSNDRAIADPAHMMLSLKLLKALKEGQEANERAGFRSR
jgi:hypothetical protein